MLVTGASAGIGKEVARGLAALGAHVILACRNREKGEGVVREIAASTPRARVELRIVDLSLQASIRDFAAGVVREHPALHALVNNAGVWLQRRSETKEAIETTWATNVLGYFFLTDRLLPLLKQSAPARIVNVASRLASDLDLGDVEFRRRSYAGVTAYAQSKQADRLFTWALARRLEGRGVTANAIHPGGVNTELFSKAGGFAGMAASAYARLFTKTAAQGADSALWLAAAPEAAGLDAAFVVDRQATPCAFRGQGEEPLWELCESMRRV